MYLLISAAFVFSFNPNGLHTAENPSHITRTSWQMDEFSVPVFHSGDVFWNISSRHFDSSRVLFIILLRTSQIQHQSERLATLLMGIHCNLDIPIVLFEDTAGTFENNATKNILTSSATRFAASYSLLVVSEDIDNVFKYAETSGRLRLSDIPIFILLIKKIDDNCSDEFVSSIEYSSLFKYLWRLHQTANVIVFVKSLNSCEDEILIYNPFIQMDGSARGQIYKYSYTGAVDKYFQSVSWNLRGYPLRVAMFPTEVTAIKVCTNGTGGSSSCTFRGRDGLILDELAKYMNFNPCIVTPSDNVSNSLEFVNGTVTGPLRDIANRKIDIAMNSRNMKVSHVADVDYVTPVIHFGMMCVLAPKAPKVPLWISLFRCFSIALWATLVVTYILSAILWYGFPKFSSSDHLQKHIHWSRALCDVLNILLPTLFTKICSFRNDSQRIFVASCLFFSIVITTVFQGSLFFKLKNPSYYKDVDTLEELDQSGLPIITTFENLYDVFDVIDTTTGKRLSKRLSIFALTDEELLEIIERGNSSLLMSLIGIEMLFKTYSRHARLVHRVQECPAAYFQSYMVPSGSPYLKAINALVGRMFEAGLTYKWYYDALYLNSLPQYILSANSDMHLRQKAFSLCDMLIAFIILIFGLILSGLIFLTEYCLKISK
jgi:hypothetical protein